MREDAELAVGLPLEHYELRQRFANCFKRGSVQFSFNREPVTLVIRQVLVYPQAYVAVVTQARELRESPRIFVLDIGGFTTDVLLLLVNNGEIRCIHIGKNIRIPQAALLEYLDKETRHSDPAFPSS